jgi:hypothetical protein
MLIYCIVSNVLMFVVLYVCYRLLQRSVERQRYVEEMHDVFRANFEVFEELLKRRSEFIVDNDVQNVYRVVEVLYNLSLSQLGVEDDNRKEEDQKKEEGI